MSTEKTKTFPDLVEHHGFLRGTLMYILSTGGTYQKIKEELGHRLAEKPDTSIDEYWPRSASRVFWALNIMGNFEEAHFNQFYNSEGAQPILEELAEATKGEPAHHRYITNLLNSKQN